MKTAYRLFNEHGYHATGIDLILAESGVSKATLYKYFRTKDELILEVLKRRHEEFDTFVESYIQKIPENKGSTTKIADTNHSTTDLRILVIFDALNDWINTRQFFGCNFINASAEYGAATDPIHRYTAMHKEALRDKISALLSALAKHQREALADQLLMLIDGAITSAQVRGDRKSALTAKQAAAVLLRRQND